LNSVREKDEFLHGPFKSENPISTNKRILGKRGRPFLVLVRYVNALILEYF